MLYRYVGNTLLTTKYKMYKIVTDRTIFNRGDLVGRCTQKIVCMYFLKMGLVKYVNSHCPLHLKLIMLINIPYKCTMHISNSRMCAGCVALTK